MKISEFRKLIREEISKVIEEDDNSIPSETNLTFIKPDINVGDYVRWSLIAQGGMGREHYGDAIGKIVKILGSANVEVQRIIPGKPGKGNVLKVAKKLCDRIPTVGETFSAKEGGSTQQYSSTASTVRGVVSKVDIENDSLTFAPLSNPSKKRPLKISKLSNIKIQK